jgi:hypothetical protein
MNDWVHSFRMPPIAEKKSVIFDKDEEDEMGAGSQLANYHNQTRRSL